MWIYKNKLMLLMSILLICNSCMPEEIDICENKNGLFQYADFPIGAALDRELLETNPAYRKIVIEQFNRISMESAWVWAYVHPEKDVFNFTDFDYFVDFAKTYNKEIIGHTLVYFDYHPHWLNSFEGEQEDWKKILETHIKSIVSKYQGDIKAWIVVNEAFNEDGTLRDSPWLKHIGPEYIELAFKWAREADPNAILFYNDFGLELNPVKLDAVLRTMKDLKAKGIPIDGIGTQLHIYKEFPEVFEINRMATKIQHDGWLIYYSEIDISLNVLENIIMPSESDLLRQKYLMKEIVKGYLQINENQQFGISFWNVSDHDTWIRDFFNRDDWPCMYDDFYQPKPMYYGIMEALCEASN